MVKKHILLLFIIFILLSIGGTTLPNKFEVSKDKRGFILPFIESPEYKISILAEANYKSAEFLFRAGKYSKAIDEFKNIIAKYPDSEWSEKSIAKLCRIYIEKEDYKSLLEILENYQLSRIKEQLPNVKHQTSNIKYQILPVNNDIMIDDFPLPIYLLTAYCYYQLNDYLQAVSYFKLGITNDIYFKDYCQYYLGISYKKMNDYENAVKELEKIIDEPNNLFYFRACWELAKCYESLKRYNDAIKLYEILKSGGEIIKETESEYWIAWNNSMLGDTTSAIITYRKLLVNETNTNAGLLSANSLSEILSIRQELIRDSDIYYIGLAKYNNGKYQECREKFQEYIKKFPRGRFIADCNYYYAMSFLKEGQSNTAEELLVKFYNNYPSSDKIADALWNIARVQSKLNKHKQAIANYNYYAEKYPKSSLADDALYTAGWLYEIDGEYSQAIQIYNQIIQNYPHENRSAESMFRIGINYYRFKDYTNAISIFENLKKTYPYSSHKSASDFWIGKCYLKMGYKNKSKSYFTQLLKSDDNFYNARASQLLSDNSDTIFDPKFHKSLLNFYITDKDKKENDAEVRRWFLSFTDSTKYFNTEKNLANNINYQRGLALLEMGLIDWGIRELDSIPEVKARNPQAIYRIARGCNDIGVSNYSIKYIISFYWMVPKNFLENVPKAVEQCYYPINYFVPIQEEAEKYNIDPFFLCALIKQESWFNPKALSHAKAMGLMQIIPKTAEGIAEALSEKNYNIYDPETNIKFGSWYISQQLQSFSNQPFLALAGYNGGPFNIKRWAKTDDYKNIDVDIFVENISYDETRNYVKSIIGSYKRYREVYVK